MTERITKAELRHKEIMEKLESIQNSISNEEIKVRLDKIDEQSHFFNWFILFSFCISFSIGLLAIYLANPKIVEIYWGATIFFIISAGLFGILLGFVINKKRKKIRRR